MKCCMDRKIEADFFNPPLQHLPLPYVRDWYSGACAVDGVPKNVRCYLLPRILEFLALGEEVSMVGNEVAFRRLRAGDREAWNADQWDVLTRFRELYLDRNLTLEEHTDFLDDAICMFALAGWPLDDLLEQVRAAEDAFLVNRLYHDWYELWGYAAGVWVTAFWEAPEKSRMHAFYTSDELLDRMAGVALSEVVVTCSPEM